MANDDDDTVGALMYATPERNTRSFNRNLAIARLLIYLKKRGLHFRRTLQIELNMNAIYFKRRECLNAPNFNVIILLRENEVVVATIFLTTL